MTRHQKELFHLSVKELIPPITDRLELFQYLLPFSKCTSSSLMVSEETKCLCKNNDVECCTVLWFLLLTLYKLSLNYWLYRLQFGEWYQYFSRKQFKTSIINPSRENNDTSVLKMEAEKIKANIGMSLFRCHRFAYLAHVYSWYKCEIEITL